MLLAKMSSSLQCGGMCHLLQSRSMLSQPCLRFPWPVFGHFSWEPCEHAVGLAGDMQHDASASMPALAQFVGEAYLAQRKRSRKNNFDVALVNQLSNGLQK